MASVQRLTLVAALATLLGAMPLSGAFEDLVWLGYCLLAVAITAFLGLAARTLRVPLVLIPLVQLLGLLVFHAAAFASEVARWGVLPTPSTVRAISTLYHQAVDVAQTTAPPVPTDKPVVMLVSMAIGLVAIVVDIVAVSLRRPAIAGLALLALYAVGTSIAQVSWFGFLCAGTGFLVLLLAEGRERLAAWGRLIGTGGPDASDRGPGQGAATRIGLVALAFAVLVPVAVPGFSANLLTQIAQTGGGRGGNGSGATGTRIDPFTGLRGELNDTRTYDLFSFRSSVDDPFYLRTSVLDTYTGHGWRQADGSSTRPAQGSLEVPTDIKSRGSAGVRKVTIRVDVKDYSGTQLPAYYAPTQLQLTGGTRGGFQYDPAHGTINGPRSHDSTAYDLIATEPVYRPGELEKAGAVSGMASMLTLPKLADSVTRTAREAVGTASTPYTKAVNLYNFFTDGSQTFRYSLATKAGTTGNDLADFLQQRQGFCEQYASAMAVMLRIEGIPSRVVLGYTPEDQTNGVWPITNKDAHAWVEGYFAGLGWVAFDPTPLSSDRVQTPNIASSALTSGGIPSGEGPSAPGLTQVPRPEQQASSSSAPTDAAGGGAGSGGGIGTASLLLLLGGVLLVVAAGTPMLARELQRRRRLAVAGGSDPGSAAHGAWAELLATARDNGLRELPTDSPRATAARLVGLLSPTPPASAALRLVALAEERARYARRPGVDGDLRTALRVSRRAVVEGAQGRSRLARRMLPPSLLAGALLAVDRDIARVTNATNALGRLVRRPDRRGRRSAD